MRYDAHDRLVAPARPSSQPLRLLAGAVLVVAIFVPMDFFYAGLMQGYPGQGGAAPPGVGRTPLAVFLLLFQFAFLVLALGLVLRLVHRRGLASLIGPPGLATTQFLRCARYLLPLYLAFVILPMPPDYRLGTNLAPGLWLSWLPLGLAGVLVQIGAEELVFRGYLQSQLAARFRHPAVWIGLPSALFGLTHFDPAFAAGNAWVLALWAAIFGAAAADLTARAGTLGPALALHFVNNIFAILVAAPAGELDGLALYTFPLDVGADGLAWYVLPVETAITFCAWLAARLALRV